MANTIKINRLGEEKLNNQGCLMKIIKYNNAHDVVVEFQDEYKTRVHTEYKHFLSTNVKNPCFPSVFGVGMIGSKYPMSINGKVTKEHLMWRHMIERCFDDKFKNKYPTYKDVTCCDEWLLYDNFYEWLYAQENFKKWTSGDKWCLDKDILIKGNKLYSPDTCCLVPQDINLLFTKRDAKRNNLPIGVRKNGNGFQAQWSNQLANKKECSTNYPTIEDAFCVYKKYKENLIKEVAQIEYSKNNITKRCYDAMINYKVEITD